jgi:hypothetical protein
VFACEGVVAIEAGDFGGWKRCALRPWTGVKMERCDAGGVGSGILICAATAF